MASLTDLIDNYVSSGVLPMHMPGHKRNTLKYDWLGKIGISEDITEIQGFDNLNSPNGILLELGKRIARLWGARESIPLVNGSTAGILASVRSVMAAGGDMLIARGCHRSVYNAAELCGCGLRFVLPEKDISGAYAAVSPESVERELEKDGNIRLAVITSPTYEGAISDIKAISEICRRHGVILLVDEAHGAHLGFGGFPESSVKLGADISVQSFHKTLPSPTQTAVIHICSERLNSAAVRRNAAIFQSSSPSYMLIAGIDGCVGFMENHGDKECAEWLRNLSAVSGAAAQTRALKLLHRGESDYDPSKITVYTGEAGITGVRLAERLRGEYGVEPEMVAGRYVLAMTGAGDTERSIARFADAIISIDRELEPRTPPPAAEYALPEMCMDIRGALSAERESVPLSASKGRVSAEYIWAYPPGSPMLIPGEIIDSGIVDAVKFMCETGVSVRSDSGRAPDMVYCVK